jgi:hypothetical protein
MWAGLFWLRYGPVVSFRWKFTNLTVKYVYLEMPSKNHATYTITKLKVKTREKGRNIAGVWPL